MSRGLMIVEHSALETDLRPMLPYGYKASCARLVKPSLVIFDIRGL